MQVERSEVVTILRASHIFKSLKDEELEKVADRIEAFLFAEKQTIYEQGSPADAIYFILSGRVSLIRLEGKRSEERILDGRDYFGEESLGVKPLPHKENATALVTTILLKLSVDAVKELLKTYPSLEDPLRMVLSSYRLATWMKLKWRGPREVVHFISRRHWMFLILRLLPAAIISGLVLFGAVYLAVVVFPKTFFPLFLLGACVLLSLSWLAWNAVDWSNDYAIVTNRRVVFLEKVLLLYDSRQEVPLDAILADDLRTTQAGRIVGYGDVLIRTYTGMLVLNRVEHPQLIINLLNELRERHKVSQKLEQREVIDRTIRQRLGYESGEPPVETPPEVTAEIKPGAFQQWLSELLLLRVEQGGVITYRTHWFILLSKTWLPVLTGGADLLLSLFILLKIIPFPQLIGLLLLLGVGPAIFLWWVYRLVDWRNDRYIITQDMIIDVNKKPLGTEEKQSAPLRNILSIDYERKGFLGLVLNFGTVYIRVGESTLTFDNVLNPAEVQRELFQRFMEFKQSEERKAEQSQREQLAEWIELYHKAVKGEGGPEENPPEEAENSE